MSCFGDKNHEAFRVISCSSWIDFCRFMKKRSTNYTKKHEQITLQNVSTKLLRSMRTKGVAAYVALLDQPQILRRLQPAIAEGPVRTVAGRGDCAERRRICCGARAHATAPTVNHNPQGRFAFDQSRRSGACAVRTYKQHQAATLGAGGSRCLFVWCVNKERDALFTACAWTSALLAAQGCTRGAAPGETAD